MVTGIPSWYRRIRSCAGILLLALLAVVVVGMQPNIEDAHIWDNLALCKGLVAYIGLTKESHIRTLSPARPDYAASSTVRTRAQASSTLPRLHHEHGSV